PKPGKWADARNRLQRSPQQAKIYKNPDNDPRGPWRLIPWDAPNIRPNLSYPITTPSGKIHYPPKGRCWSGTEDRWKALVEEGLAYFGKSQSGVPMVKRFLKDDPGIVPNTWWSHEEAGHSSEAKREILSMFPDIEAFATPKPERLMRRIIGIGSNPEDVVLDCFLGSGTTCAVAHKMGRRWIGIEWSAKTLETFAIPRLASVADGTDPGGVTKDLEWQGGGGFRMLDVAPSMFEEDGGAVVLADWAVNSQLAEATAAQLGYEYEMDPPFCGRKGRARLAVVDGLVNEGVVELLVQALPEGERLVVCGTGIDPSAREVLRELRPGSTMRRIPASILEEYRRAYRRFRVPSAEASGADGQAPIPL
ncbi:MAG: site-specific DNA-methyltransferase, partial [Acidimicrobiia bacterium]